MEKILEAECKMRYQNEKEIRDVVRSFEDATIGRDEWKHAEHLTVALVYLSAHGIDTATEMMRSGIFNLLKNGFGVDLEKEMPYHETLTVFWMQTIESFLENCEKTDLLEAVNELVSAYLKDYALEFYSRELLFSGNARANFVRSDL